MEISPSNPNQDGSRGVQHDDRPDSSHEAEVRKADSNEGTTIKEEDHNEGRNAGAHQSEDDE